MVDNNQGDKDVAKRGDVNGFGFFGPCMKFSGFDGVLVKSCSQKPV